MNNLTRYLMPIIGIATLFGCASNSTSYRNKITPEINHLAKKIARSDSGKIEITQPISHILSYLKYEYSASDWEKLSKESLDSTKAFESIIQNIYGKSLYRIAGGEMQFKEKYPYEKFDTLDTLSVEFVKILSPNKIPNGEREILKSELEIYTRTISEILAQDTIIRDRFNLGLSKISSNGKIRIILATNPAQAKIEELKRSYAQTNIGYTQTTKDSAQLYVKISTKYFGLISTSTILHELIHAVVGIIRASPDKVKIPSSSINDMEKVVNSLPKQDMMIEEGIAESISQSYNPMYNSGYFNSVNKNIIWQKEKFGKLLNFEDAEKCYNGTFCSFDGRIMALYEANSFVNYLIKNFGYPKVLKLAASEPNDKSYIELIGKSRNEIFEKWKHENAFQ